jgi:GWxTD domain-containing protein
VGSAGARRTRCSVALAAVLVLAMPAAAPASERDPHHPGPLPWRAEGLLPFTVDAATFADSNGTLLEVYVRIPPATLGTAVSDSFGTTQIAIATRLRGGNGRVQESRRTVSSAVADSATGLGKVVAFRFVTQPGTQKLRVRLEDLNSRKRGLFYVGRQVTNTQDIEGEFSTPRAQMGRQLSDVEFLWGDTRDSLAAAFRRDTSSYLPNPERLYGRYATDLRVYFAAESPDERPWHWVIRVLDSHGQARLERDSIAAAARRLGAVASVDVSTLPAGGYDLEVKAWQEGDSGALQRRAHFSVAWHALTWTANPGDAEDAVHLLLSAEREEAFSRLEPGEREQFLDEYWRVRDPTPETAENEALEEFLQRIDYVNRTYTRPGFIKGMDTDMGRVYVRYGQPDEVLHQVMPAGDETLDQVLDELAQTENRPATDVRQPGLGGDIRPYEVWIYEHVIPTPFEADPRTPGGVRHRKLTFLFVDQQGMGQYTLRYSTE